jgi:S-DNA-T family DNA segregation ATPase FtsK/SpoIIIE
LDLLDTPKEENSMDQDSLKVRAIELEKAILPFEFVKVSKWIPGPMATTFYTELEADAKVSNLLSRSNDIARSLGLPDDCVRISGNIKGQKNIIGIELPNPERSFCLIRKVLEHPSYKDSDATLPLALGIGIDGEYICEDLSAMPHLLLAGSTGSGKTVALNVILLSLIYRKTPSELNLVLIDPKLVEFSLYRGIPHLLGNIVTDMDESVHVLRELIDLMDSRYQKFQNAQVTKINEYNSEVTKEKRMPHTVVFIDELGDLMLSHGKKVEDLLGRLSQKARAAGIHLVLATQRPTSDIIKGLIKANIPTRLAFKVSNNVDSRVILDSKGAESMLGKGDCLLKTTGSKSLKRIQSPLVTTEEIKKVVKAIN